MVKAGQVLFVALVLGACSGQESAGDPCLAIVREYQAAMPYALECDPGVAGSCAAGRPLIVSEQASDGTVTLHGLCMAPCFAAVNPKRTAALDEVLARFHAEGCTLGPCWCPRPESMPPACVPDGKWRGIGPS